MLTQLLAELTRGAPNQPAVRAALDELLAAALPRIVDLAVTAGHAELADLASLALQLAPQPGLAAPLADQMPEHSVRLAALAATLTSQQVTQYRAGTIGGEPDAARPPGRVAEQPVGPAGRPGAAGGGAGRDPGSRRHLPGAGRGPPGRVPARPGHVAEQPVGRLADLGRREDALAAIQEAATIYRELAAARPDAFRPDLAMSLNNLSAGWPTWGGGRTRWPRARKPPASTGSWPRPARTRSGPTWPCR